MAIVIEVKAPSVTNATVVLEKMERLLKMIDAQAKQTSRSINRLGKAIKNLPNMPSGGGASPGASIPSTTGVNRTGGGGRAVKAPPKQLDMNDPYNKYRWFNVQNRLSGGKFQGQRNGYLQQAFQQAQSGAMSGDLKMMARMSALSGPMARMAGNTPMNRIMQAVMTSRVGIGKGGAQIMPLVGRTLAALGGGGGAGGAGTAAAMVAMLANPVGIFVAAILATVAGVAALGAMGLQAAEKLSKIGAGAYMNGATLDKSGQAQMLDMMGINPGAIHGAIMESGMARSRAAQAGMDITGGPLGAIDKVTTAMGAAKIVMEQTSESQALRAANDFKDPALFKLWLLRPDQKKSFLEGNNQMTPSMIKLAEQTNYDKNSIAQRWENLMTRIESAFMPVSSAILSFFEAIMNFVDQFTKMNLIQKIVTTLLIGTLGPILGGWTASKIFGGANDKAAKEEATKENTQAVKRLTRAMTDHREVLGGGPMSQRMLPKGIAGQRLSSPEYREALRTGVI